jgi:predicted ArsR family transcriptional regulator
MHDYGEQLAQVSTALADPTRREIMQYVLDSDAPLSAQQVAQYFGLHVNAARMHLDKLVKGGLLRVIRRRDSRGGRPAHLYYENEEDREILFPSRCYKILAEIFLAVMSDNRSRKLSSRLEMEAARAGREEGLRGSSPLARIGRGASLEDTVEAWLADAKRRGLKARLARDPEMPCRINFLSCPFGDLAKEDPELLCPLHRGIEEGLLSLAGDYTVEQSSDKRCLFTLRPA